MMLKPIGRQPAFRMFSRNSAGASALRLALAAGFVTVMLTLNLSGQLPGPQATPPGTRENNGASGGQPLSLDYRRVFFPQQMISEIPMSGRYYYMSTEDFHRRMKISRETGRQAGGFDNRCILQSMELSARLEDQQLVAGKGVMRIGSVASPNSLPQHVDSATTEKTTGGAASPGMAISLAPFRLALSNPAWTSGKPAYLGLGGFGETVLYVPPDAGELTFDWSLRGGTDFRNELVFSFDLPRFLRTELTLDLPANRKPLFPQGIVRLEDVHDDPESSPASDIPAGFRRWHIAVNGNQALRLIIAPDETSETFRRSIGVSELHTYDLSLFGTQLNTRFFLEKSDFVLNELTLELDKPLSPLSVKSGDRVLPWTEVPSGDENVTKLLLSIPYLESGIREIQVQSFCPTQTDHPWNLPRVHVRSPLFFWNETRNIVHVNRPLLTQRIIAPQQREENPSPGANEAESDLFGFQSFSEDAPLGIELGLKQTVLNLQSGTAFQWGEREIIARAVLDFSVDEGQVQQLELDVDANWTVDLIESTDPTRMANYFVEEAEPVSEDAPIPGVRWVIPLRRAIDPSQPLRLIVQLRRPLSTDELPALANPEQKRRYLLSDFMPILVPGSRDGQQLIAFEFGRHYRLVGDHGRQIATPPPGQEQIRERFDETPRGTVFSIENSFKEHFLEVESPKPSCRMTAVTHLVLHNGTLTETCRLFCTPAESSLIGRLTVRFSQAGQADPAAGWTWSLGRESETLQQIKATKITSGDASSPTEVEIWDLELTPSRSMPFEMTATRVVAFDAEQAIPLPFFPEIAGVDAYVCIETRDSTLYRVVRNQARAVSRYLPDETTPNAVSLSAGTTPGSQSPRPSPPIDDQRAVRGVYRYLADVTVLTPKDAMLVLEPIFRVSTPADWTDANPTADGTTVSSRNPLSDGTAHIWSLALHSHYHPDGKVVSFAILAVENRMLDRLKIGLPPGVTSEGVRNLWIDRTKTSWSCVPGNGSSGELFVKLPPQRRYLTVTVEYALQRDNLHDNSVLEPAMPTFDVPVFSQKWYAWYPPQFRGFDVRDTRWDMERLMPDKTSAPTSGEQVTGGFGDWPALFDHNMLEFDLFSSRRWFAGKIPGDVKREITGCSQRLVRLFESPNLEQRVRQSSTSNAASDIAPRDTTSPGTIDSSSPLTWGELFASRIMEDMVSGDGSSEGNSGRHAVLVDGNALAQSGVMPSLPVFSASSLTASSLTASSPDVSRGIVARTPANREKGLELMEHNSLAVIFDAHRNMLVTSVTAVAKLQPQLVPVYSNRFWYDPSGNFGETVPTKDASRQTVCMPAVLWQNSVFEGPHPMSFFNVSAHPGFDMPGWAVHEVACDAEFPPSILLVRHDTLLAGQLFVFFLIVLVSWRIRPDRMTCLIVLLILSVVAARLLPPYLTGMAYSAFWGLVFSIAFGLLRFMRSSPGKVVPAIGDDQTTAMAPRFVNGDHDDSESGEVRSLAVPPRPAGDRRDAIGDITDTEIQSSSRNATPESSPDSEASGSPDGDKGLRGPFLLLLIAMVCVFPFFSARPLSAQSATTVEGRSATASQAPFFPERASETTDNPAGRIRGGFDVNSLPSPYRVYIPYDPQGKIGDYYYLPESLHKRLQQAEKDAANSGNWQIRKAQYVGTLMQDPVQNEVTLFNLRVVYDIELHDRSAVVRLPEMPVAPNGIRCDNQLLQPTIEPVVAGETGGNVYVFTIFGRGGHQLEISLLPTVFDNPETSSRRFEFPIPPVPDSTLELTLPVANLKVDVSQPVGQLTHQSNKLLAELGATKRLFVSWPMQASLPLKLGVSQYFRLHTATAPEQTKLHARFHFTVSSGSVRHILLSVDPRYIPDGSYRVSGGEGEIVSDEPVAGSDKLRRITFRQPVTKSITIEADYIPAGIGHFSGIGTLALPRFSAKDARIERSWLGISSAPSTETELPLSNIETRYFDDAWGTPDEPVHHAYDLLRPQDNWFLTVKSRPVYRQINQRQWMLFRNQSIITYMEEDVTPTYDRAVSQSSDAIPANETISTFYHEMTLPEGFRCETVEIKSADGTSREKPRFEQKDRNLVLFFKKHVFGRYSLSLFGTMTCESNKDFAFPLFTHNEQATVHRSVFCYRDTSVLVQRTVDERSVQPIEVIPNPMKDFPSGYFISAFRVESLEQFLPSMVNINPNKPEIKGVMVSRLERNFHFDRWDMIVTWDITISHGELDQVTIFLPVRLGDEILTALPDIYFTQTDKNDGTLVQLNPREPLSGEQFFGIRFPIVGTLDTVSVPEIQFLHDCDLRHYVALPESSGLTPLNWTLANLSPTDYVPPVRPPHQRYNELATILPQDASSTHRYYLANPQNFSAKISVINEETVVSCHDVTCLIKRNGFCFLVSAFDIQGKGSPYCDIAIPKEYQLVQTQLNDIFPLPERIDDTTVRVELLSDIPAQRLTMICCSQRDVSAFGKMPPPMTSERSEEPPSRSMSLPFPRVLSFPVRKTLWEVYYEPSPLMDTQVAVETGVWDGHSQASFQYETNTLSQADAGNLRVRVELARLNQTLAFFRLMSSKPQDEEKFPRRQTTWNQLWQGTRQRTARLLSEWNPDKEVWETAFLLGKPVDIPKTDPFPADQERELTEGDKDMAWIASCFSKAKTPRIVYDSLFEQHKALTEGTGASSPQTAEQNSTVEDTQTDRERDFYRTRFWDDPARVRYLAGATPNGMTAMTLTLHPRNISPPYGVYFHYVLWGMICLTVLVLAILRNTRQLFERFTILFIVVLVIFCWLFVRPNMIGWTVLIVLMMTAVRIQWKKMRTITTMTRDGSPVDAD